MSLHDATAEQLTVIVPTLNEAANIQPLLAREIRAREIERRLFLFMDVLRPLSYLAGLLNRMTITAIAASPFIRDVKMNHEAWERRMFLLWN
jgi:hypothetical protein